MGAATLATIIYRFNMTADEAGSVYVHATVAAGLLSNLLDRLDHYESVLRDIGDLVDSPPADRDLVARWHALESQMQATVDELTLLADEAREQGRDVLKTLRTTAPRADRTLQAPRSSNPLDIAITHHVIVTAAAHSARDAAEQIQRLVEPMSKIADPALLIFSGRLAELAIQVATARDGPRAVRAIQVLNAASAAVRRDWTRTLSRPQGERFSPSGGV